MKTILTLSFTILISIAGLAQNSVQNITVSEFETALKNKIILVDVRTAAEFREGHLDNAVNIDWYDPSFMQKIQQFDKKTPVYLYCRSGKRSTAAAQKLAASGFKKIYSLEGGISEWQNSHKTVQK